MAHQKSSSSIWVCFKERGTEIVPAQTDTDHLISDRIPVPSDLLLIDKQNQDLL